MAAIELKTAEEIELQRESSLLVGKTLAEVAKHIRPGVATIALDRIAETFIRDHGAVPGFKGYGGFPGSLCISVNDEIVHGIPGKRELKDGDVVSIDCGVVKNGFYGDSAYTFAVGSISAELKLLLERTRNALYEGIGMATEGNRVGDISFAIQNYIDQFGYGIVRELVGHGVGRRLHEAPEVPNFGRRGTGPRLVAGMVIAIEPMINLGTKNITQDADGWTIRTADRRPSAHFEHTVAIGKSKADVLSSFEMIEEVLFKTEN
ncbi:MAG TPA: type I methionyl aminopeptidase [Bacteroidales bacterium]|nr:type I methionyl aminopeptidase [Bacteroidales bacterium]